jgi:hypothetical protein
MKPKTYNHHVRSANLPDPDGAGNIFFDSQDITTTLDYVGFPKRARKDITAVYVVSTDGDYDGVWLCEDSAPYDNQAVFRPLPFYRPVSWTQKHLPWYWLEKSPLYNK